MAKFLKKKEKKDHTVSTFKVALLGSKGKAIRTPANIFE